jgi:hypothetical protein
MTFSDKPGADHGDTDGRFPECHERTFLLSTPSYKGWHDNDPNGAGLEAKFKAAGQNNHQTGLAGLTELFRCFRKKRRNNRRLRRKKIGSFREADCYFTFSSGKSEKSKIS